MEKQMKNCDNEKTCDNRREFLVKTTATAGGLILSLAGVSAVSANETTDELTVKLDDKSELGKVGGSQLFDTPKGKIIVVRTSETAFKAYSAVCTHKGGTLGYNEKTQQLACPLHGSKFDLEGKNASGPAKTPLSVFATQSALVVNLKTS